MISRLCHCLFAKRVLQAKEVVIIANGASKAVALQKAVEGGVNHMDSFLSAAAPILHDCRG